MTLRVVVLLGPTATGKTRLGVQLAHRWRSEILSVDSRQVYQGLDLGTGKDLGEYAAVDPPVPYHLIDLVPPTEVYTLFRYQQDCHRLLRSFNERPRHGSGRVPLLMVGGTGLYAEAVIRGYRIADVPADGTLRRRLETRPHHELVAELRRRDPELASGTDLSSSRRVVRALEIVERGDEVRSGDPLGIPVDFTVFAVSVDRALLRERIARRVDERVASGMVDEVRGLLESGVPRWRLDMLGLEYRELAAHVSGEKGLEDTLRELKTRICQLAKRQETYLRGLPRRGVPVRWIGPGDLARVAEEMEGGGR